MRLRIEQVSSVEHATASGVPTLSADGDVVLGPGLGRPLLLTTLEVDEAMRVLASDQRNGLLLTSGLLVATPIVILVGLIALLLRLRPSHRSWRSCWPCWWVYCSAVGRCCRARG